MSAISWRALPLHFPNYLYNKHFLNAKPILLGVKIFFLPFQVVHPNHNVSTTYTVSWSSVPGYTLGKAPCSWRWAL